MDNKENLADKTVNDGSASVIVDMNDFDFSSEGAKSVDQRGMVITVVVPKDAQCECTLNKTKKQMEEKEKRKKIIKNFFCFPFIYFMALFLGWDIYLVMAGLNIYKGEVTGSTEYDVIFLAFPVLRVSFRGIGLVAEICELCKQVPHSSKEMSYDFPLVGFDGLASLAFLFAIICGVCVSNLLNFETLTPYVKTIVALLMSRSILSILTFFGYFPCMALTEEP